MTDAVEHPAHYTAHPSGVECIDVVRHMNFNRGNAVKYIWRAGLKGDAVEDLRKARFYIDDEIVRIAAAEREVAQGRAALLRRQRRADLAVAVLLFFFMVGSFLALSWLHA